MKEAALALTALPQANGRVKNRPVLLLRQMPPFGDWLVCGVSSQVHQQVPGFDELLEPGQPDFLGSGLKGASICGLGFLAVVPESNLLGVIGAVAPERHHRLLRRSSEYLLRQP